MKTVVKEDINTGWERSKKAARLNCAIGQLGESANRRALVVALDKRGKIFTKSCLGNSSSLDHGEV